MNEHKFVQNLLPNYIDGLTDDEVNDYIENHLKNCAECKAIYDNMTKDEINFNDDTMKIDYLKKHRFKLRLLLTVIITIIMFFLISYLRNCLIIIQLKNKSIKIMNDENLNLKIQEKRYYNNFFESNDICIIGNTEKKISKRYSLSEENNYYKVEEYIYSYNDEYSVNTYIENNDGKVAVLNNRYYGVYQDRRNYFEDNMNSIIDIVYLSINTKISKVNLNNQACYRININKNSENYVIYFDFKTGLIIKELFSNNDSTSVLDKKYTFNCVSQDELLEPNIEEYTYN